MARNAAGGSPTPQSAASQSALSDAMMNLSIEQSGTPPESKITDGSLAGTPPDQMIEQGFSFSLSSEVLQSTLTQLSAFSPFSPEQVKAASDEQIVNAALLSFLQATTMYQCQEVAWTLHRNILKMEGAYEARTDGCLWTRDNQKTILAILETKAHVRRANERQIMIQESAQMAAWIYQTDLGDLPKMDAQSNIRRRLLISQDCREIYITIGEYDNEYKRYLVRTFKESKPDLGLKLKGAFLKMRCYGPFDMERSDHMKTLAVAIVAFTTSLQGS